MGWLWSSSPSPITPSEPAEPTASPTPPSETPPSTRDEQAEEELRAFLAALEAESRAAATTQHEEPQKREPPPDHSHSLYPDTMSCAACFDQAYYCSSVGGQLNAIYRYGGLRSCSDLWAQWRFCMRTRAMGEAEKKERIREWYQERAGKKYKLGRSSEDVWEVRKDLPEDSFRVEGRRLGAEK